MSVAEKVSFNIFPGPFTKYKGPRTPKSKKKSLYDFKMKNTTCFHPVGLCVCVCVCVCLFVCPVNILIFYFSAIRRDIDLKFIQDTYRVVRNSLKTLTVIGQRSRSQGRYISF